MKFTDEEKEWSKQFNIEWFNKTKKDAWISGDIMVAGIRVGFLGDIERGKNPYVTRSECAQEGIKHMQAGSKSEGFCVPVILGDYPISFEIDRYMKKIKHRVSPEVSKSYTPRDYFTVPEMWFTGSWADILHHSIDESRGRTPLLGHPESNVPGAVFRKGKWRTFRHKDGKTTFLGSFFKQQDAEIRVINWNKYVTLTGCGVEYTVKLYGTVLE
jgi:hypothetical protein